MEIEQNLDPEEARAIIDPALKIMIDDARHYDSQHYGRPPGAHRTKGGAWCERQPAAGL
jgi:hypothetical protein